MEQALERNGAAGRRSAASLVRFQVKREGKTKVKVMAKVQGRGGRMCEGRPDW